tara:strand:- start:746 stop:1120 length:375 start_codon:yes stop_codon:yes gene_type:complete
MNKRVTLSYTIDLEDLGQEVSRLYADASRTLCVTADEAQRPTSTDLLTPATVNAIHNTRLQLSKIDALLGDISDIIEPYLEYAIGQTPNDDEGPGITDMERLRALQEKVTNALAASSPQSTESE